MIVSVFCMLRDEELHNVVEKIVADIFPIDVKGKEPHEVSDILGTITTTIARSLEKKIGETVMTAEGYSRQLDRYTCIHALDFDLPMSKRAITILLREYAGEISVDRIVIKPLER